jgi:hypothetical protein
VVEPVIPLEVAVMIVGPVVEAAVTRPCEPELLLMFAIPVSDEAQVTDVVIFRLLLFE